MAIMQRSCNNIASSVLSIKNLPHDTSGLDKIAINHEFGVGHSGVYFQFIDFPKND
jgi:hypothetical protein